MFGASRTAGALALALAGLLALTAAAAAAEYTSSPLLEVRTISHYEPEVPSEPGKTELDIQATFGWHVTVTVRAHGATVLSGEASIEEAGEFNSGPGVLHTSSVTWSCKQPGTVYSYEVTATPELGEETPLTKSGSFVGASRRQCREAPRLALRKHREAVRRQREEELARDWLYEANCRKVGGKPVTIQTNRGPEIVCRSQTGGIVEA
jgi:hypothetical protein